MRRIAISAALTLTLCTTVHAAQPAAQPGGIADAFIAGIVQPDDIALVFRYLREALAAAAEDREAPPPDELAQRAESIAEEVRRRGALTGRALLDAIENALTAPREPPKLPPSSPLQRI